MKKIEEFLTPTQRELFRKLTVMYENAVVRKGSYILVPGKAPVMLVAHLDTVHREPVKTICRSDNGNILMSPQGIGGDDRRGSCSPAMKKLAAWEQAHSALSTIRARCRRA